MKQSELEDRYSSHLIWMRTQGKQGKRLHMVEENLQGLNLHKYKLEDVWFTGCKLINADFSNSLLTNIVFDDNNLEGVKFINTIFKKCCLMQRNHYHSTDFQNAYLAPLRICNNYGTPTNIQVIKSEYPHIFFHKSTQYSEGNILQINETTLSLKEWKIYFTVIAAEKQYTEEEIKSHWQLIRSLNNADH